jgi:sec-independent protein translocase protein TatA
MGGLSPFHWVFIGLGLLLLFGGRGRLSSIMGDAAKGIRAFQDGLKGDEAEKDKAKISQTPSSEDKNGAA